MQTFFNHRYTTPALLAMVVAATVAFGAFAYNSFTKWNGPNTIMVTGTSEIMVVPDVAEFSFSVRGEGTDATTAQSASAEKINAITTYLRESEIAENDIKTTNYNLMPKYRYEQPVCTRTFCPPGEQVPDGFEVFQTITVKVRDTAKAGDLLAGVGERGATDISGLTFTVDDMDAARDQARDEAIKEAKAKAEALADSLGVRLGKLVGFYEDEQPGMPVPYYGMGGDMMARSEMAIAPDIPTGENTVTSRVSLTYQIK
jgi:uncharacterized protein YggE